MQNILHHCRERYPLQFKQTQQFIFIDLLHYKYPVALTRVERRILHTYKATALATHLPIEPPISLFSHPSPYLATLATHLPFESLGPMDFSQSSWNWPNRSKFQWRIEDVSKPLRPSSSIHCGWDLAECLNRLTVNAVVVTVLGSIPASSDTVESKGRQTDETQKLLKQRWISYIKKEKIHIVLQFSELILLYYCCRAWLDTREPTWSPSSVSSAAHPASLRRIL